MPRPRKTLPHVKRVMVKGRTYFYFDTGAKKKDGQPVLARLPDIAARGFGDTYGAYLGARTRRLNVVPVMTLGTLIDRYQRSPEFAKHSESTKRTYNIYLQLIDDMMRAAPANEVTRRDVIALLDTLADRPGAANMTLGVFTALFAWGRKRELVTIEPTKGIEPNAKRDYEPWPEPLLAEALEADDRKVRLAVGLLYFTAQRIGDVARMRWSNIRGGVLFVRQQKTGKDLEIPVHPELALTLGARPNEDRPLICHPSGMPVKSDTIRTWLQLFAGKRGYKVVAHGLRKNAVNALLEAGCTAAQTAAVSGQSLQLVEHYAKRRSTGRLARDAIGMMRSPKREQENFGKLAQ